MERYTIRQVNRALAQEQLLKRLEQGEEWNALCQELGLSHSQNYLSELRRRYRRSGCAWEALIDHRHGHLYKVTAERRAWLRKQKQDNPAFTQEDLVRRFEDKFQVSISQSHVSNILRAEGVALPGGQRYHPQGKQALPVERAGVFFPSGGSSPDGDAEHRDPGGAGAEEGLPGT